jgi:hypothetical protein
MRRKRRQGFEESEPGLHRIGGGWRLETAQPVADRRNERREIARCFPEERRERLGVLPLDVSADGLRPRPVGRERMVFRTPTPEDGVVGKAGAREELLDRMGLSDARVADQREEAAASGARVAEAAQEGAQLGLAADEHAAVAALRMPRHPDGRSLPAR